MVIDLIEQEKISVTQELVFILVKEIKRLVILDDFIIENHLRVPGSAEVLLERCNTPIEYRLVLRKKTPFEFLIHFHQIEHIVSVGGFWSSY